MSMNNVELLSKLCMDDWMAAWQTTFTVLPQAPSRFLLQIDREQRLNHRDRSCKTFGWIALERTRYAPEIGRFVENTASKLPKMWSENGRMNHGKRWWASPPWLQSSLWRSLIARHCRKPAWPATWSRPPLMYTYMLQTPLLCGPLWLFIHCRPAWRMYMHRVQTLQSSRRPNGRQLFWIPRPPLPLGNGQRNWTLRKQSPTWNCSPGSVFRFTKGPSLSNPLWRLSLMLGIYLHRNGFESFCRVFPSLHF